MFEDTEKGWPENRGVILDAAVDAAVGAAVDAGSGSGRTHRVPGEPPRA